MSDSSATTSCLLASPAEVRNLIYIYALTGSVCVKVGSPDSKRPPLLSTCKQIKQEAIKIFFGQNSFRIEMDPHESAHLSGWLKSLSTEECQAIASLTLTYRFDEPRMRHWRLILMAKLAGNQEIIRGLFESYPATIEMKICSKFITEVWLRGVKKVEIDVRPAYLQVLGCEPQWLRNLMNAFVKGIGAFAMDVPKLNGLSLEVDVKGSAAGGGGGHSQGAA